MAHPIFLLRPEPYFFFLAGFLAAAFFFAAGFFAGMFSSFELPINNPLM